MDEREKDIREMYADKGFLAGCANDAIGDLLAIIDGLRAEVKSQEAKWIKYRDRNLIAAVKGTHESRSWEGRVMDIEKKLTEIIKDAVWDDLSRHTATKFAKAILASPDIAVVGTAKLEKKEVNTEC